MVIVLLSTGFLHGALSVSLPCMSASAGTAPPPLETVKVPASAHVLTYGLHRGRPYDDTVVFHGAEAVVMPMPRKPQEPFISLSLVG